MPSMSGLPQTPKLYRLLCVHSCDGTDHADWVTIYAQTVLPDGTLHHHGHCHSRPLTLVEGLHGDIPAGWTNPCPCWDTPNAAPHPGHCCYADQHCNHYDLIRACEEKLPIGDVPMWPENNW